MPEGTALYLRGIRKSRHKTPKAFAKKCRDHGLSWIAIAAVWQELRNGKVRTGRMNKLDNVKRYRDALEARDIEVWTWGYPWTSSEERFVDLMREYDDGRGRVLIDPELGSNPTRQRMGPGKTAANAHAEKLVRLFAGGVMGGNGHLGLSTFGSGWKMGWFPLLAFTKALIKHFGGRTFIGGQTYTDDSTIDTSIADMATCIGRAEGSIMRALTAEHPTRSVGVQIVPNFGSYIWQTMGPRPQRGKRRPGAKAKAKTPLELRSHLHEFINEGEPVDAVIGWAENFMTPSTWGELARFADLMERGACRL